MIACTRCGKDNQDHYKFCLGCGADITSSNAKPVADVGMMKTMMADSGGSRPGIPGVPGLPGTPVAASSSGPVMSPLPGTMPPAGPLGPLTAPPMAPLTAPPMGPPPGVPGFSPAMPSPANVALPMASAMANGGAAAGPQPCPHCSAAVPAGFRFCGACGQRVENSVAAPMPVAPPIAPTIPQPAALPAFRLTLIRPDGTEGGGHELKAGENKIGRQFGPVFETDGYLSPTHADVFVYPGQGGVVRDLGSLNGVFVKMQIEEELVQGQILRIGQELLRFEFIPTPDVPPDGTEVMGSPNPGFWGRLVLIIGNSVDGPAFPLVGERVVVGRDRGDITFPDDGYVSGTHAELILRDGKVFLRDAGSANGTFMKVNGERAVSDQSCILLGQQLFRLNM